MSVNISARRIPFNIPKSFIAPTPQPSELIESTLVRAARLNGLDDSGGFVSVGRALKSDKIVLAIAERLLPGSASDLLLKHTLIPLQQAFVREATYQNHGRDWAFSSHHTSTVVAPIDPRHCPRCLEEDLDWHGFSFYRRHHQIHAVTVCGKHATPLIETQGTEWRLLPSDPQYKHLPFSALPGNENVPIAHKFRAVAEDLLELKCPIPVRDVSDKLRAMAAAKGFKFMEPSKVHPESFGYAFLQRTDPDAKWCRQLLERRSPGQEPANPAAILNRALYGQASGPFAYILAALLLAPGVESALTVLVPSAAP